MDPFHDDSIDSNFWAAESDSTLSSDMLLNGDMFADFDFSALDFPSNGKPSAISGLDFELESHESQGTGDLTLVETPNFLEREIEHPQNLSTEVGSPDRAGAVDHDVDEPFCEGFHSVDPGPSWLSSKTGSHPNCPETPDSDLATSHSQVTQQNKAGVDPIGFPPLMDADVDSGVTASKSGTATLVAQATSTTHHRLIHCSSEPSQTSPYLSPIISNQEQTTANNTLFSGLSGGSSDIPSLAMGPLQVHKHGFSSSQQLTGQPFIGNPSDATSHVSIGLAQSQRSSDAPDALRIGHSSLSPPTVQNPYFHTPTAPLPPNKNCLQVQGPPETRFEDGMLYRMSMLIHEGLMDSCRPGFSPDHIGAFNTLQAGMQEFLRVIYARMHHPGLMNRVARFIDSFSVDPRSRQREPHDTQFKNLSDAWRNNQRKFSESQRHLSCCRAALQVAKTELQQQRREATGLRNKLQTLEAKHEQFEGNAKHGLAQRLAHLERIRAECSQLRNSVDTHGARNQEIMQQQYDQYVTDLRHARQTIDQKNKIIADQKTLLRDYAGTLQLFSTIYTPRAPQRLSTQDVITRFGNPSNHADNTSLNAQSFAHTNETVASEMIQFNTSSNSTPVVNQQFHELQESSAQQHHPIPSYYSLAHDQAHAPVSIPPGVAPHPTIVAPCSFTPTVHQLSNSSTLTRNDEETFSSAAQSEPQIATSAPPNVSHGPMSLASSGYYPASDGPSGNSSNFPQPEASPSIIVPEVDGDCYSAVGTTTNGYLDQPEISAAVPSIDSPNKPSIDLAGDDDAIASQIQDDNSPARRSQLPLSPSTAYQTPPATYRGSSGSAAPSFNSKPSLTPRAAPRWIQAPNSDRSVTQSIRKKGYQESSQEIAPCPRPAKRVKTDASAKKPAKKSVQKAAREKTKRATKREKAVLSQYSYEEYVVQCTTLNQPVMSRKEYEDYQHGHSSPCAKSIKQSSAAAVQQTMPSAQEPIYVEDEDDDPEAREIAALLEAEMEGLAEGV
ncbi:MAG: hypothetical protein Q9202_004655 [Teloschistes flavicans]